MAAAVLADEILTAESKRALIEAWPLCCNGKGSNAAAGVRAPVCCRSSVIDSPKRLATKPPWLDMNTRLPVTAAPNSESTANDPLALELVSSIAAARHQRARKLLMSVFRPSQPYGPHAPQAARRSGAPIPELGSPQFIAILPIAPATRRQASTKAPMPRRHTSPPVRRSASGRPDRHG